MKQGIEKVLEEFDKKFVTKSSAPCLGCWNKHMNYEVHQCECHGKITETMNAGVNEFRDFLRSAVETAFKEVRPKNSNLGEIISDSEGSVYPLQWEIDEEKGYNDALSDYDQAVKNYLGK